MIKNRSKFTTSFYKLSAITMLLMFIVNLVFVFLIINDFQKGIEREDGAYMTALEERIERDLQSGLEDTAYTMFKVEDLRKYIYVSENAAKKNTIMIELMEELKRMLNGPGNIFSDCAIYYPESEELLSGKFGYFQLHREANISYRQEYNIDKLGEYSSGTSIIANPDQHSAVVTSIYKFSNGVTAIFVLKEEYFDSLIYNDFSAASEPEGIIIQDYEGNNIYQNGRELEELVNNEGFLNAIEKMDRKNGKSVHIKKKYGDSYLCTVRFIDDLGIMLIKLRNENMTAGLKNYSKILAVFIIGTFAALMAGYYITYRFSKRMFGPIKKLLGFIPADLLPDGVNKNEIELIGEYMESSQMEMEKLRYILDNNKVLIKDKLVKYLVENENQSSESINEYLSMLDIRLDKEYFIAVEVLLSDRVIKNISYTESNLMKMRLIYEMENLYISDSFQVLACEYLPNKLVALINTGELWKEESKEFVCFVEECLKKNYSIPFFVSVGTGEKEYNDIPRSAKNAQEINHFFLPKEINHYFSYEETETNHHAFDTLITTVANYENSLSGALYIIDEAQQCFKSYPFDTENCNRALTAIVPYFISGFKKNKIPMNKGEFEHILYPQIHYETIYDYFSFISEKLEGIEKQEEVQYGLFDVINKYVIENINKDLSLDVLSMQVNMSPKYLSKLYKEQTGQTISSFILERRIEQALEELKNTNKTIEVIALETGFSSSAYFIKCFKSKMGMTPKNYRDSI